MPEAKRALQQIEAALSNRRTGEKEEAVDRIAALFIAGAPRFSDAHVALFDQVIGLLTDAIELRARARLAERLADIANAPPELMRRLARDEITVARPVLARSPRLADEDLIEAARQGGRDHMLAISERRALSEPVTDLLVEKGDRVVVNAVASNPGARFSDQGYEALVAQARSDALLQAAVGRRNDIPPRHMAALFELAKAAARQRLSGFAGERGGRMVAMAVAASAKDVAAETRARSDSYRLAVELVSGLMQANALGEETLVGYARAGRTDETIVALSFLAKVPIELAEQAFQSTDTGGLLIIARAADFSWPTLRDLYRMRPVQRPSLHEFQRLEESYGRLTRQTAERVLRFMHARDSARQ
jgi:uncharacterized protein (DUF2336 family)